MNLKNSDGRVIKLKNLTIESLGGTHTTIFNNNPSTRDVKSSGQPNTLDNS